jgi:hypothetical protein
LHFATQKAGEQKLRLAFVLSPSACLLRFAEGEASVAKKQSKALRSIKARGEQAYRYNQKSLKNISKHAYAYELRGFSLFTKARNFL